MQFTNLHAFFSQLNEEEPTRASFPHQLFDKALSSSTFGEANEHPNATSEDRLEMLRREFTHPRDAPPDHQETAIFIDHALEQIFLRVGRIGGYEQGFTEGRERGAAEGLRCVLLKQLQTRFGALSDELVARVMKCDDEQLVLWCTRIFSALSPADVLA